MVYLFLVPTGSLRTEFALESEEKNFLAFLHLYETSTDR